MRLQPGLERCYSSGRVSLLDSIHAPSIPRSCPRSSKPPAPNLLCREVLRDGCMYHPPAVCPSWTRHTPLRALDTQGASKTSRSYRITTGGPGYLLIHQRVLRLCHHQHAKEATRVKVGTSTNTQTSLVPPWHWFHDKSSSVQPSHLCICRPLLQGL